MSSTAESKRGTAATSYLFVAPLLLALVAFVAAPIVIGAATAFESYRLADPVRVFAGWKNFAAIFTDPNFVSAIRFSIVFAVGCLVGEMVLGIALALLFERHFRGHRVLFTITLFPIIVAPAFIATLWQLSLNSDSGIFGALVARLGISSNLLGPSTVVPTLIMIDTLHWAPFVMIMVYAGLKSVPAELHEAAKIDGAGYWRTRCNIVAPYIAPILAVTMFLRVVDGLKTFDTIYILTGGGPGVSTMNINIYAYKQAFTNGNFGTSAATSLLFSVALVVLVPFVTRVLTPRKGGSR